MHTFGEVDATLKARIFTTSLALLLLLNFSVRAEGAAEKKSPDVKPEAPAPAPAEPAAPSATEPELFTDPLAGYSLRIPLGYHKLTADESREVFRGISEYFGKDIAERAQRRPPQWFGGPIDPKKPKSRPPSLAIGYTDLPEPIDPAMMPYYKKTIEEEYRAKGEKHGEISIEIVKVDGINSLRVEHETFSPIDNSRAHLINLLVPGDGKRYDIVFNYSTDQQAEVREAVSAVQRSFKIDKVPVMDQVTRSKWMRIALWTVGSFVGGILISFLLRSLAGVGQPEPARKPTPKA